MEEGKTERIVLEHKKEIEEIRKKYPHISKEIEIFKKNIRKIMKEIKIEIENIPSENDKELLSVLVINGIHKMTDEIFLG